MIRFSQLLLQEKIFLIIAIVGLIAFFTRAIVYYLAKEYNEGTALNALFVMRFAAAFFIGGLFGYASSLLFIPMPTPITYAIISSILIFMILFAFSRPLAYILGKTMVIHNEHKKQKAETSSNNKLSNGTKTAKD